MLSFLATYTCAISTKIGNLIIASRAALNSTEEEMSLFEELWQYFTEKYFSVRFEQYNYQYIDLGSNSMLSAQLIIVSLFLGIIIAAAVSLFQKRTLGDLVRAMDREGIDSPEKAMTLEQLGFLRNAAIKESLRRGTALKRVVRCVEEEAYLTAQKEKRLAHEQQSSQDAKKAKGKWKDIPYRYDFYNDHFYIPQDKMFGASVHFDKKGTNPLMFAFTVICCVVLASVVCWLLPELFQMADNFIGVFRG